MRNAHVDNLAPAIVKKAYCDYRKLLRRCKTWQAYKADCSHEKRELECFFRSRWCAILTDGNGEYIMRRAKEEILRDKDRKR